MQVEARSASVITHNFHSFGRSVDAEYAGTVLQRLLVRALVAGMNLAPVAMYVTIEEVGRHLPGLFQGRQGSGRRHALTERKQAVARSLPLKSTSLF